MSRTLLSGGVALALAAAFVLPAHAGETMRPEQVAALIQENVAHVQEIEKEAVQAYSENTNPLSMMLEKVGPYDLSDAFVGPNGFSLPGWAMMRNSSGGGDGGFGG